MSSLLLLDTHCRTQLLPTGQIGIAPYVLRYLAPSINLYDVLLATVITVVQYEH